MEPDDVARNWDLIALPPGQEWSGRARYAAAMFFYGRSEMSAEVLEVYRICSRLDSEDPISVLRRWQLGEDWIRKFQGHASE